MTGRILSVIIFLQDFSFLLYKEDLLILLPGEGSMGVGVEEDGVARELME